MEKAPLLLSIETATEICSVCLSRGSMILAEQEAVDSYQHIEAITILIQQTMDEAAIPLSAIDAIVISEGPGSYTALRVGAATAKGICYALDKPLIAVSTLKSLAWRMQSSSKDGFFIPMIDARRMEVFAALYNSKLEEIEKPFALIVTEETMEAYSSVTKPVFYGGSGAAKCKETLGEGFVFKEVQCNANNLVSLGIEKYKKKEFVDLAYFSPFYLKPPNITVSKKKL